VPSARADDAQQLSPGSHSMTEFDKEAATRRFFFRKENRLLKRAEFLHVYSNGKVYRRPLVHVFVWKSDDVASPTRLGVTATKKTGKAVRRNRGRRLVRESFRLSLPDMKPGYWMVVNLTRAANQAPFDKVDAQLRDIWKAAGVLGEVKG